MCWGVKLGFRLHLLVHSGRALLAIIGPRSKSITRYYWRARSSLLLGALFICTCIYIRAYIYIYIYIYVVILHDP